MLWIKLGVIMIIVFALIPIVKLLLRKLLKIEKVKKEFFSFNHINDLHRKVDKGFRILSTITLIPLVYVLILYYEDYMYLVLVAYIVLMVLDYTISAFFEWKYTEYPKQAILTLAEMAVILIAIFVVIEFELLGPLLS